MDAQIESYDTCTFIVRQTLSSSRSTVTLKSKKCFGEGGKKRDDNLSFPFLGGVD